MINKNIRLVFIVLFAALFIVSASVLVYQGKLQKQSDLDGNEAMNAGGLPDPNDYRDVGGDASNASGSWTPGDDDGMLVGPDDVVTSPLAPKPSAYAEALRSSISIIGLKSQNSDVAGWMYIGGSRSDEVNVNEPIIYYKNDNDYYLRRSWLKNKANDGCIFMEHLCHPDFSDFNTIIYGHRLKSEKMFGKLGDFTEKQNWEKDPYIYIYTADRMYMYKIYSVYRVSVSGKTFRIGFSSDESKQEFIDFTLQQALYDTGTVPTVNDRILTLSTCTGDQGANKYAERFIVQAVLVSETSRDDK